MMKNITSVLYEQTMLPIILQTGMFVIYIFNYNLCKMNFLIKTLPNK